MKMKLHWQILFAILLAVVIGKLTGTETAVAGVSFYAVYDFFGTLFINALKMIIVPLIVSSIVVGVSGLGKDSGRGVGRMGAKTLGFYAFSSLAAILVGLLLVNLLQPGMQDGKPAGEALALHESTSEMVEKVSGRGLSDVAEIFIRMIPTNIVEAAAEGQMLGLIFFSILFGFFMTRIEKHYSDTLYQLAMGVYETMIKITLFVMHFAPIGVFALVAKTVASTGFSAFMPLLWFFITVVLALAIHVIVIYPLILIYFGVSPVKHFHAMLPAILTAFSTASSSATLPLTIESIEKNAGVSSRTSGFVLPLGATVNMDGTALYECVAALFLAQAYGIELSFSTQFTVVILALLTSIGVAGVPAASLVAITIILTAIGLPVEAIGLILVTDRILDMCRTAVNVYGDSCAAVSIARSEGEETLVARY